MPGPNRFTHRVPDETQEVLDGARGALHDALVALETEEANLRHALRLITERREAVEKALEVVQNSR
jgi:hypothetical protein